MGLLSDTKSRKKMSAVIVKHSRKLMFLSFMAGIAWFCLLASDVFNNKTYFSENALLPGLVLREFNPGSSVKRLLDVLTDEAKSHPSSIPSAWIQAQFRQIGLDVYYNNYTLEYPFGTKLTFSGNNIYAVLRAPKVASTEALVISTPYRGFESIHENTLPSIAIMIELASTFRRNTYWSKDIIFLITEHENVGFQAWLDAYHGVSTSDCIKSEYVKSSGLIQGVINLEISSSRFTNIDVKVQGLHGQLPNLDFFNLAIELCNREQVPTSFYSQYDLYPSKTLTWNNWLHNFITMSHMIMVQSTGLPNGGHGLFHRFGIQAITLKSESRPTEYNAVTLTQMGRVIEGITRSLNNLLEKFHQSFFFYLLPSTRTYISIGLYMPPFALIGLPIILKALHLYINLQSTDIKPSSSTVDNINYWLACDIIIINFLFGILMYFSHLYLDYFKEYVKLSHYSTEESLYIMHAFLQLLWFLFLSFYNFQHTFTYSNYAFKVCVVLLILGTFLYTLALVNISFALIITLLFVPISVSMQYRGKLAFLHYLYLIFIHPFVFTYFVIVVQSYFIDRDAYWYKHFVHAFQGHKKVLLYVLEDSYIFNNWNYKIATVIIHPLWFNLWFLKSANYIDQS